MSVGRTIHVWRSLSHSDFFHGLSGREEDDDDEEEEEDSPILYGNPAIRRE